MIELLFNEAIYQRVIQELVASAQKYLWIATADIKDLHVERGKKYVPFVQILAQLLENGVEVRLLHAKEPGPRWQRDFDRFPIFLETDSFERILCPRIHCKIVIADGQSAYQGSANLTGAGMGAKHPNRRNFESGILTDDPELVGELVDYFDALYLGVHCPKCRLRSVCPDPIS